MNRISYLSLSSVLALGLLAGCPKPEAAEDASKDEIPVRSVRTAVVGTGDLVKTVEVIGELQGVEEVRVFAMVADRIRTLTVREGDRVKRGQLLAVIRSDLQNEGVNQAQAGLDAAVANGEALADQVQRTRALVQAGTAPRSQLDTLEAQLRAAQAQVRQMSAMLSSAAAQKDRSLVTSPIAGVVTQLNLKEGDMASPQLPILTVVRDDALKAVLRVPERDFVPITTGMPVRVTPLADARARVDAEITLKGPIVDRMTRTGLVEVRLDNADGRLVPGSAVRAEIEVARTPDVMLVPAKALILTPNTERTGEAIAFVVEDGKAFRRDIRIGVRQGSDVQVTEGLKQGETLVTLGAQLLRDENPIRDVAQGES